MKLTTTLVSLIAIATAATATKTYNVPLDKDAGLIYTNMKCGDKACSDTNLAGQTSYTAFLGNKDFRRILLGFKKPDSVDQTKIKSCMLMLPASTSSSSSPSYYNLIVRSLGSDFDPNTVTPKNAPVAGDVIGQTTANDGTPPPSIDVTSACRNMNNGMIDLGIDATSGPATFPSMAGGSSAQLMIVTED
ncbi:hypothetical protein LPJ73_008761 [Coemansia sp. RSA 2703]|nr:hypothetical protein LPJ73_008761 [Coemansia sp. RSA 2703]KAJ2373619.1 hypothetical protein IW150_003536 [Coemansia sp. RSA 2607]